MPASSFAPVASAVIAQARVDAGSVLLAVGAVVIAAALVWPFLSRRRQQQALERLLARDRSLMVTNRPCGYDATTLAERFAATPRGDRRHGVRLGVTGPLRATLRGADSTLGCAAFQWWWEVRRTRRAQHGRRTTYEERRTTVAAVTLPVRVPDRIVLRPESALGRIGLTRGGHQLESSEFNRRFRVEANDRTLTVQLLDAGLQELLTTAFAGRTVELRGDLLLLAGSPGHRDTSLAGVVGELPAVRQDAQRLLAAVPPQFWRAVGVST